MCGIAGVVDWRAPVDPEVVWEMTRQLEHRGPDAKGVVSAGAAVLGHTRLAVIDLGAHANQPLRDVSGRCWIVYNGEVYNHRELRLELERDGAGFRTKSDTEVVVEAYKRWGDACVERLDGMFAFAIWDLAAQRLLLARDRLGKKPLYHLPLPGGGIAFASELGALRRHPACGDRVSPRALREFLALNYVLSSSCMIEGVAKLPPAHVAWLDRGKPLRSTRYWDLARHFREKQRPRPDAELEDELAQRLRAAARKRLVADVPVGLFLSGGVDSSTIAAVLAGRGESDALDAFGASFREHGYDEMPGARAVAATLGLRLGETVVDDPGPSSWQRMVRALDEPFADTSFIATYQLCEFARRHVTVCLSGDGGDEVFAGYETYKADSLHRRLGWLPAPVVRMARRVVDALVPVSFGKVSFDYKLRHLLAGLTLDSRRAHYSWRTIFGDDEWASVVRPERLDALRETDPFEPFAAAYREVEGCSFLDQAQYVDIKTWLVDDILTKLDRASMAHGLEARAPLLDTGIVEFGASLPVAHKLRGLGTKRLLRRVQGRHLPATPVDRKKRGFNAPVSHWLAEPRGGMGELARAATRSDALLEWIDDRRVDSMWRQHERRERDNGLKLFGLATLGLWLGAS
ncbi:MAG: asparagine synthase (glutamine-hydrolyzing) [Myxococcota bacterium]|nr:asparagine synthase (glutamine-hydrolyzing) [Myxococcota bacterium]